ncbi:hypothetical protein [Jiangella endophytica]|nr:hypothetical protein [Jiangella endophytica]
MIGAVTQWSLAIAAFGSATERWLALTLLELADVGSSVNFG